MPGYGGQRPELSAGLDKLSTPAVRTITERRASGVVTVAFSGVRVKGTAVQVLTSAVDAILTWDAEDFDSDNYHSLVLNTSRLTPPVPGYYRIFCSLFFAPNATASRWATLIKNGATIIGEQSQMAVTTALYQTKVTAYTEDHFGAGEYVECRAHQNSGGNLNVDKTFSHFGMSLIAAD